MIPWSFSRHLSVLLKLLENSKNEVDVQTHMESDIRGIGLIVLIEISQNLAFSFLVGRASRLCQDDPLELFTSPLRPVEAP